MKPSVYILTNKKSHEFSSILAWITLPVGTKLDKVGARLEGLGDLGTSPRTMLGQVGTKSGQIETKLGPSWGQVDPSWDQVGPSWTKLGVKLGPNWIKLGPSDPS